MPSWLNRTVIGAGLTSLLADLSYEFATALLPAFLLALGLPFGVAAQVMGAVEAAADFLSNSAKLVVGWYSDRIGRRKELVVFGYGLTGIAFGLCAVAFAWPMVLAAKCIGWLGKGVRGPLRNALLTDAVAPEHRGKAFGFHRAGDTVGAVLGPLAALAILYHLGPLAGADGFRSAFWLTLIPGVASAVVFAVMIRETRFSPKPGLRLGASVAAMPPRYRRFLGGVLLFGLGDFSHTLLILLATSELAAADPFHATLLGVALYAWRNAVQAAAAFPAGWLTDRFGAAKVLLVGYTLAAGTMAGFAALTVLDGTSLAGWAALFAFAGIYMAIQETAEPVYVPQVVPDPQLRGTAFGVLAAVNGFGDVGASLGVGFLFGAAGPAVGLLVAASLMLAGAAWIYFLKPEVYPA